MHTLDHVHAHMMKKGTLMHSTKKDTGNYYLPKYSIKKCVLRGEPNQIYMECNQKLLKFLKKFFTPFLILLKIKINAVSAMKTQL